MQSSGVVQVRKPPLPVRLIIGLCLTVVSLLLLVIPGAMVLPMVAFAPLFSGQSSPCFNVLAGPTALALFGFATMSSAGLIAVGITGIVLAAIRVRAGLLIAVVINAIVASLFLMFPLSFTPGQFSSQTELATTGAFNSAFAVLPLTAAILLLAPSFYRSTRTFVATAMVVGVLLIPGAMGLTAFGLDLAGVSNTLLQNASPADQGAHC